MQRAHLRRAAAVTGGITLASFLALKLLESWLKRKEAKAAAGGAPATHVAAAKSVRIQPEAQAEGQNGLRLLRCLTTRASLSTESSDENTARALFRRMTLRLTEPSLSLDQIQEESSGENTARGLFRRMTSRLTQLDGRSMTQHTRSLDQIQEGDEAEEGTADSSRPSIQSSADPPPHCAEVRAIAEDALDKAQRYFDGAGGQWVSTTKEAGVQISNMYVQGERLPMIRGLLEVPASTAPRMEDIATVMLSHSGRRFFDPTYESTSLLEACSPGAALVCVFLKAIPSMPPRFQISAVGTRRTSERKERITKVIAKVPQDLAAPHMARVDDLRRGVEMCQAEDALWAADVVSYPDGRMRIGYLVLPSPSHVRLPLLIVRKFLEKAPLQPITVMMKLAQSGMIPRHTVAFAGPVPEETEEMVVGEHRVQVSVLLRGILGDR